MPWGAAVGAVVGSVANKALSGGGSSSGGGAGTQTVDKSPWVAAQPWILSNMATGQALQQQYADQPFSAQQSAAYDNSYLLSDAVRAQVPALLQQLGSQQVGFDKTNPTAKQTGWDWTALLQGLQGQKSVTDAKPAPAPAAAPKSGDDLSSFIDQVEGLNGGNATMTPGGYASTYGGLQSAFGSMQGTGGFGTFRYGMATKPGTQERLDQEKYFQLGGSDPNNYYGRGPAPAPEFRGDGA